MYPRDFRKKMNWTLVQLAKKTGKTHGYLSRLERGLLRANLEIIKIYSEISKGEVTADDFIRLHDEQQELIRAA